MTGPWIQSGNYIQFKIKPVSSSDKITVSVAKDAETPVDSTLSQTVFSSTDSITEPKMDGYYCQTPLMKAYKQAFVVSSGLSDDGWYQVSVPAPSKGNKLVITLESTDLIPAGSKILMDDLTIQFASTYKSIKFSSSNATATGACLVTD